MYLPFLVVCAFCHLCYGQAPNWQVNVENYRYSMSLIATGDESCLSSLSNSDIIGIFDAADKCRGKGNLILFSAGYRVVMTVYGNDLKETLSYKIYDASKNKILVSTATMLDFSPETIVGSISSAPEILRICEEDVMEECVTKLVITDSLNSTTEYEVGDTLISTSIISGNSTVVSFKAEKAIILKSGFWARPSSTFSAVIEDCTVVGNALNEESNEWEQVAQPPLNTTNHFSTKNLEVQLYPNPASVSMTVKYYLKEAEETVLYIVDYNGKVIQQFSKQKGAKGWNVFKLDTVQLGMGCYFLTLKSQSESITKKVIIIK